MYNINIVFTRHKSCGICNSFELCRIIESIQPEIIFEELSIANFHKSYQEEKLQTLETDAIKMYLQRYPIKHITIDTFDRSKSYDDECGYMLERITRDKSIKEVRAFCQLLDEFEENISKHGFRLLNSEYNDEYIRNFHKLKESILNYLNDDRLFQIHKLDIEVVENREDEMLANIYRYSKEHQYNQALFFIGSGHRESILQKIVKHNEIEEIRLNWSFYVSTKEGNVQNLYM